MSMIRRSKTGPELKVRSVLKLNGFTYQPKGIYGKPDFADRKNKIAIFVDGCFWHKCRYHYKAPGTNANFWMAKINKNVQRDRLVRDTLEKEGYKVIRFWEHVVNSDPDKVMLKIKSIL